MDAKSGLPVYEQVKQAVKNYIVSGRLAEGEQIMSIRDLATWLRIHPNTIAKVYSQLELEGFLHSRPGSGYYVQPIHAQRLREERLRRAADEAVDKARQLGYTLPELIAHLQARLDETGPAPQGEHHDLD